MQTVKKKSRIKTVLISTALIISVLFVVVSLFFIYNKIAVNRALTELNIRDESTVINVMKYGGDREDILLMLADSYAQIEKYTDAARLMLYTVQYVNPESEIALSKLIEYYTLEGANDVFISQFKTPNFKLSEFEISTEFDSTGYGVTDDGIYTVFLGGYAKAKLSSSLTAKLSACETGVYYIDASDFLLKLLNRDGSEIQTVSYTQMSDFVNFKNSIYYIDLNGVPHGANEIVLDENTFCADLRIENGGVVCTLFDNNYTKIRDLSLS